MTAAELAIHALAQLPDSVGLELASSIGHPVLRAITEAYGFGDRVRFGSGVERGTGWFVTSEGQLDVDEQLPASLAELVERIGCGAASPIDESHDSILTGERIVLITNYPAHYRLPLFRGMAERLALCGATMHAMFLSEGDADRPWLAKRDGHDFGHEFLRSVRIPVRQRGPLIPSGLETRLRSFRPSLILGGLLAPRLLQSGADCARARGDVRNLERRDGSDANRTAAE